MKLSSCVLTSIGVFSLVLVVGGIDDVNHDHHDSCCICDDCEPAAESRAGRYLGNGKTCEQQFMEVSNMKTGGTEEQEEECDRLTDLYKDVCCRNDADEEDSLAALETLMTSVELQEVPSRKLNARLCNLCHDGGFPGKPNTVTSTLGIPGTPTCKDLYYMGRNGGIPDQLCNPLQDAYDADCLCYHFSGTRPSGGGGGGGGSAPAPAPRPGQRKPPRRQKPRTKSKSLSLFRQSARGNINRGRNLNEGRLRGRSE